MLTSGIYGLFRFDGGPVDAADAAALGFAAGPPGPAMIEGVDPRMPAAVHRTDAGGATTVLVGELDELGDLAGRLGLAPDTPPAELARAALARFGGDTPARLLGEWTLLHRDARHRLTLMASAARRDPLFYAVAAGRCAVAPDLVRLSRVGWIDGGIDPAGLLFRVGRAALRDQGGDRTVLAGVRLLAPGSSVTLDGTGERQATADLFGAPARFAGSFDDAVADAEAVLRRIMAERFARTARPALLLSGGLDSSLLAWLAAETAGAARNLELFTSAAPPGSGLPDETRFADAVAGHLGYRALHVAPPPDMDSYGAPDPVFAGAAGPLLTNRHCLTATFQALARDRGATLLLNGTYGEMSVTGSAPYPTLRQRTRAALGRGRRRLFPPSRFETEIDPFHVRLAPGLLADLPEPVRAAIALPERDRESRGPGDLWGVEEGAFKGLAQSNLFHAGAVRMDFPYRDLRLLRLFAGFPAAFMRRGGVERAMARSMLAGRLPDLVRLRPLGMPASPEHMTRLRRQAPAARARVAAFRAAGIGDWLDLDWLDTALARIAATGPAGVADANRTQLTALAAEYLLWWRERR